MRVGDTESGNRPVEARSVTKATGELRDNSDRSQVLAQIWEQSDQIVFCNRMDVAVRWVWVAHVVPEDRASGFESSRNFPSDPGLGRI